jgi:predicted NBD/HSP70 family sugar kinase
LGHIILDLNGPPCSCGTVGCVEAYVGRDALVHRAVVRLPVYPESALEEHVTGGAQITAKLVAELAGQGDELCLSVMADVGLYVGQALCNVIVTCDPDVILIGGGIAGAGDVLFEPIRRTVRERTPISGFDPANIIPCGLGYEAGAVGAAALVWERSRLPH